jgi:hypothetical protein
MAHELLELSCNTCDETKDLSLEERLEKFKEALKDGSSLKDLNINGENFLHILLWDFKENGIKISLLHEFINSKDIPEQIKKDLFFQTTDDDEAPIDYLIETLENGDNKIIEGNLITDLFKKVFTTEEKLKILAIEKEDGEIVGHTFSNISEELFLMILFDEENKIENLSYEEKLEFLEILKAIDEDGEAIYTTITDKPVNEYIESPEEMLENINKEIEFYLNKRREDNKIKKQITKTNNRNNKSTINQKG